MFIQRVTEQNRVESEWGKIELGIRKKEGLEKEWRKRENKVGQENEIVVKLSDVFSHGYMVE